MRTRSVLFRHGMIGLWVLSAALLMNGAAGPSAATAASDASEQPLHIHMISGSKEYKSAKTLPEWGERLEQRYNVKCTFSMAEDGAKTFEKLDALKDADLLVLFFRRFKLKQDAWQPIKAYLKAKKPILGIRTASHAFDKNAPKFDRRVLGANYHGHAGRKKIHVTLAEGAEGYPILEDVEPWTGPGKLYKNNKFADSTTGLLKASGDGTNQPVTWTNTADKRRVFYTPQGLPIDFENEPFLRLLRNAVAWTTQRPLRGKAGPEN